MLEIERRFIARVDDGALRDADVVRFRQGYLPGDGTTVRIRRRRPENGGAESWLLTIKAGQGLVRHEVEFEIDAERGGALMELAGACVVEKTRHTLGRWEIDVFHGPLDGLVLAEAELESEDEALPDAPAGLELGLEVTEDPKITSHALARMDEREAREFVRRHAT